MFLSRAVRTAATVACALATWRPNELGAPGARTGGTCGPRRQERGLRNRSSSDDCNPAEADCKDCSSLSSQGTDWSDSLRMRRSALKGREGGRGRGAPDTGKLFRLHTYSCV